MLTGVIRKINNGVVGRGSTVPGEERSLFRFRCQNKSQRKVIAAEKNNLKGRNASPNGKYFIKNSVQVSLLKNVQFFKCPDLYHNYIIFTES